MKFVPIKNIKKIGNRTCYDLEVEDNHNFFLANNVLTHNSRSGKGEAFAEKNNILQKYSALYKKGFSIKSMDGSETLESFYNSFEFRNGKYDFNKPTIGSFEQADIIDMEECSYIFVEKRGQKQTKAECMLKALEDKPLLKQLASWNGRETLTTPNFIYFSSTRPIPEVQETIATSGLLQRTLPYFRNLTSEERKEMNAINIYNKIQGTKSDKEFGKEREKICKKFREVYEFTKKNPDFNFEDKEGCYQYLCNKINSMEEELYNNISRMEHKKIAEAFIAGFVDKIVILSLQNAILRKSNKVKLSDIENACYLVSDKIYKQLCLWIEQTIDENRLMKKRRHTFREQVKKWFRQKSSYTTKEFADLIVQMTKYSPSYAYHLIDTFSKGKGALLKHEDSIITLNIGGGEKNG